MCEPPHLGLQVRMHEKRHRLEVVFTHEHRRVAPQARRHLAKQGVVPPRAEDAPHVSEVGAQLDRELLGQAFLAAEAVDFIKNLPARIRRGAKSGRGGRRVGKWKGGEGGGKKTKGGRRRGKDAGWRAWAHLPMLYAR